MAAPKARKAQKTARIIYESTEASIFENIVDESTEASVFENIVDESRAQALKDKNAMLKVATGRKLEEQWEDSGEESVETLVRKMQAKVKEDSKQSKGKMVDRSWYGKSKAVEPVEDVADGMDVDVQIQKEIDIQIQREMDARI